MGGEVGWGWENERTSNGDDDCFITKSELSIALCTLVRRTFT